MDRQRRWPWFAQQTWNDVLFMHWPVPYQTLRPYVPHPFEVDTYAGDAWVSVVLFQATHSRLRGMPQWLSFRSFLQLNVRTYVLFAGIPGVYFFSLDANSPLAVTGARWLLPFHHAQMTLTRTGNRRLFVSRRTQQKVGGASLSVDYRPTTAPAFATEASLTYWLTERYHFFTLGNKIIYQGSLSHAPWRLQQTRLDLEMKCHLHFLPGPYFQTNPLAHYTDTLNAYLHPFVRHTSPTEK